MKNSKRKGTKNVKGGKPSTPQDCLRTSRVAGP